MSKSVSRFSMLFGVIGMVVLMGVIHAHADTVDREDHRERSLPTFDDAPWVRKTNALDQFLGVKGLFDKRNWYEAKRSCESQGRSLPSIRELAQMAEKHGARIVETGYPGILTSPFENVGYSCDDCSREEYGLRSEVYKMNRQGFRAVWGERVNEPGTDRPYLAIYSEVLFYYNNSGYEPPREQLSTWEDTLLNSTWSSSVGGYVHGVYTLDTRTGQIGKWASDYHYTTHDKLAYFCL